MALASSGDLAGARAVLERAVELGKVNLSEDDPDVLLTAYQLGTVLQQADDPSGARRVLEEAYAAGLFRLGDSDALMLKISHGIGVVAEELGNRHEARKAFGRVAELGPPVLGGDHWAVVRARGYLGLDSVRPEAAPAPAGPTTELGGDSVRPSVQPPSPANQRVWGGPANVGQRQTGDGSRPRADNVMPGGEPYGAIEEPTIAQPVIAPRSGTHGPPIPDHPGRYELGEQRPTPAEPAVERDYPPPARGPAEGADYHDYPPRTAAAGAGGHAPPVRAPSEFAGDDHGNRPPPVRPPAEFGGEPGRRPPPVHAPSEFAGDYGHPSAPYRGAGERSGDHGYPPAAIQPAYPPGQGGYQPGPGYSQHGVGPGARQGGPAAESGRGSASYRKGLGLFAAVAAVLASIIAVAALVFVLANRSGDPGSDSDVPTLAGPPPSDVRLRDGGSAVKVTWQDPSNGTVSFMVTMGRRGEALRPMTTLGPGQTSYELGGLNASLNYCFTVIAVYKSDQFATSPQACTNRASATPR